MKSVAILIIGMIFSLSAFAKEAGFYTKGISASTKKGAKFLVKDLSVNDDNHDVCYSGDYESAVENVHSSISITINDVFGESENPPLDADVLDKKGEVVAYGIIPSCD